MKATGSVVFEDLKFKVSEGHDQNWCFPAKLRQLTRQSQKNTNLGQSEPSEILNFRSSTTPETVA